MVSSSFACRRIIASRIGTVKTELEDGRWTTGRKANIENPFAETKEQSMWGAVQPPDSLVTAIKVPRKG